MSKKLREVVSWIRESRRDIYVVVGWAIAVALVTIKAYWVFYVTTPKFYVFKIPFSGYQGPTLDAVDVFLMVAASIIAGLILADAKKVVYGYVGSIFMSFFIAVAFASLYIWFALGWGEILSSFASGWEWAILWAVLTMFKMVFPTAIVVCFLGVIAGSFLRIQLQL